MSELATISAAEEALAVAGNLEDTLEVRHKIRALELLLREIDDQSEIAQRATILRIRAERKVGEFLIESRQWGGSRSPGLYLVDTGVSKHQARRWRVLAELEQTKFDGFLDEHVARGWMVSTAGVIKYAENSKAKKTGTYRSGPILLNPGPGVCWLRGYKVKCAGPITGGHIIHKGEVVGNAEARRILATCPDEIMSPQCYEHNVGRWANHRSAKRILVTLKIYELGLPRMMAWFQVFNGTFKVPRHEFKLEVILDV